MTSQHFGDGWDNWETEGDWVNSNNNQLQSSQHISQQNQQYVHHQPTNLNFAYQPHQQQQQHQQQHQSHAPPPLPQPPFISNVQQQTYQENPVNFFNSPPLQYNDSNNQMHHSATNGSVAMQNPFLEKQTNYNSNTKMNTMQFSNSNLPSSLPVHTIEHSDAVIASSSSTLSTLPPPPPISTSHSYLNQNQNQNLNDAGNIQGNANTYQTSSVASTFDYNYNPVVSQGYQTQLTQRNDQRALPQQQQLENNFQGNFSNNWQMQTQQTQQIQNQSAQHAGDQPPQFENNENIQPSTDVFAHPPPSSTPLPSTSTSQVFEKDAFDSVYPENRERLDEVPSSTLPILDRHNYMVTGQLSQENSLPPPVGLSRMVVGEPENPQQPAPLNRNDIRMVTGNEMTPESYINYQRQADGEVSSSSTAPVRSLMHQPVFNQQQVSSASQQHIENDQQSFNIIDRNLYLVAGESDVNSQLRVVPGVESDVSNSVPFNNIINPLQNLHIEDDEDFVNVSVTTQRNVDGDGMDEQQHQRVIDNEQREEDIEGANDNIVSVLSQPLPPPPPSVPSAVAAVINNESSIPMLNEQESSDIREDIEGANDYSSPLASASKHSFKLANESQKEEKRKSIDSESKKHKSEMSSEDSELRELEKNARSKVRRSKKYNDSNDSESDHVGRRDDKRSNRDKMSREEYDKYRRRERERRSAGGSGSKHDSRRRNDDEEDDENNKRRQRRSTRGRRDDEPEGADEKDRKREKNRKKYFDEDRRRTRERGYYSSGRPGSASDREYDKYGQMRGGYYQQPYGYYSNDSYNQYYQQQQYFETLRRTNPQAYEWYKNYYSGMNMMQHVQAQPTSSTIDPAESLRSGYSSSNEKERASMSRFQIGGNVSNPLGSLHSSYIENANDYHASLHSFNTVGKDFNPESMNYKNQNYGYDMYGDQRNKIAAASSDITKQRLTPQKFQCLHGSVSLSNGFLTTIDTFSTDEKYLVKIENVPIYDRSRHLFQSYPGPLVRGISHKKTVIDFCEEKLKQNLNVENGLRASYSLLWSYLILMLRQNGTYTEGDISELLMKNSDEFRSLCEVSSNNETKSASNSYSNAKEEKENENDDENKTDVSESDENDSSEQNSNAVSQNDASTSVLSEKNVLDKFKNFLLYGNINDALTFATDNNLWGHALFLASKLDSRHHANVMLKFANKLSYNDPLQTLYQIMSGRTPACVTNLDDKFGDWRPHLAMIISNCNDKPELVKSSIMKLGDTLLARGDVYGSHFCYLLMDPQFTEYSDKTMTNGKIALLGTTVQKSFKEFASTDSIIMTEVYEYARSLSTENFFITSLQKFKFLLASDMLDYGNQLKCLLYLEQISKCIVQQPHLFDANFIKNVCTLADRLKFYDPVMEKSYEDNLNNSEAIEDPKWLQDLSFIMNQNSAENSYNQQYTPQHTVSTYPTLNEMYNPADYQQKVDYDPMTPQQQTPVHAALPVATVQTSYMQNDNNQQSFEQQYDPMNNNASMESYNQNPDQSYQYIDNGTMQNINNSQNMMQPGNDQQQQQQFQYNYMQPTSEPSDAYNTYGSWNQPKITMGNASSFEDSSVQNQAEQDKDEKNNSSKKADEKIDKKQTAQDSKNAGGGGLFSRLFFGKAKSTQMKLPDDKNPSIVWDENTKKWVNKDADPTEAESFKPPPKLEDMMRKNSQSLQNTQPLMQQPIAQAQPAAFPQNMQPQQQQQPQQYQQQQQQYQQQQQPQQYQQQSQQQPQQFQQQPQQQPTMNVLMDQQMQPQQNTLIDQTAPPVPAAPNMFKMQKGRNLKKSYVDILGNAGHTVSQPKELAPQMDMQFVNPQPQVQGMQFYNPNDFQ